MLEDCLKIPLDELELGLVLSIFPEGKSEYRVISAFEALEYSESKYQILEGNSYEYLFNKGDYKLQTYISGIVVSSISHKSSGRIVPNIYVGTLTFNIVNAQQASSNLSIEIEVLATKFNKKLDKSYRENYRFMLEDITDKCTELLMQINSPIHQSFEINFESDEGTIYQRFCFIQSILNNAVFTESIEKIISNPKTNWESESESVDIRRIRKVNSHSLRQIISGTNRVSLPEQHLLNNYGIKSLPLRIDNFRKVENIDTAENRFIKHVLVVFKQFCEECSFVFEKFNMSKPLDEALLLIKRLENHINHSFFNNISSPDSLKLNSPVLQKRSGYREILNRWLQFDLASKLIWKGGDDVYKAGKKDIASLYEYWLFFSLYDLVKEKFNIESVSFDDKAYKHLIVETNDGLNIMLKSGKHTALQGVFTKRNRDLNIKFSYNRTFKGGVDYDEKVSGSWTTSLRPDYTLSIWPKIFSETEAEANESIVHIHFDAKYKIDIFYQKTNPNLDEPELEMELNKIKIDERKGTYKNVDLLKMHAYKDAIRRSGGAYILYPGARDKPFRGFHEIIPGLGAFSVNPSSDKSDLSELSKFIDLVIDHLLDRTSQREKLSNEVFNIFKEPKLDKQVLHERIPEYEDSDRVDADKNHVIVGFYKSEEQLNWILKTKLYNLRTGTGKGSFPLSIENINAKYLVLHGSKELITSKIFKLETTGPIILSRKDLILKGYPNPMGEIYLVYNIEKDSSSEFDHIKIDLRNLAKFESHRNSAKPFIISLTELLKSKIKDQ